MTTSSYIFTALLAAFISIGSEGVNHSKNFDSPKSGLVTAKVDGQSWEGKKFDLATFMAGQLHIEAKAEDGTGIKLALFGANEPGTIKVGAGNMSICAYLTPEKSYMSNVITKPGVVEITEISSSGAKGTFEFYCGDHETEIHITEGAFDVNF